VSDPLHELATTQPLEDLMIPAAVLGNSRVKVKFGPHGAVVTIELPPFAVLPKELRWQLTDIENQLNEKPRLWPDPAFRG
jgi:hypothetical protein